MFPVKFSKLVATRFGELEAPFKQPTQATKNILHLKGEEKVPASVEKIFCAVGKSLSGGPIERK